MVWFFKFGKMFYFITICTLPLLVTLTIAEETNHGMYMFDIQRTSNKEVEHSGIRSFDVRSMRIE